MGYGLIDIGAQTRRQTMQGMNESAKLDEVRETANKNLKAQQKQQTMTNVGTGAAVGAMAGAQVGSVGGPWGAVTGAGVGLLASLF